MKEEKKTNKTIVKEIKYKTEDLLKNCQELTGAKREVGEGAIFNLDKTELTKKEFQNAIDRFLNKKIKEER